jgi:3-hydroxyisobutyrate dehydrogenase-like beta-hydroxyacid dehydrogenase
LFDAPVYRTYGDILLHKRFEPAAFAAPLGLKDLNLADAAALSSKVSMPFLGVLRAGAEPRDAEAQYARMACRAALTPFDPRWSCAAAR